MKDITESFVAFRAHLGQLRAGLDNLRGAMIASGTLDTDGAYMLEGIERAMRLLEDTIEEAAMVSSALHPTEPREGP